MITTQNYSFANLSGKNAYDQNDVDTIVSLFSQLMESSNQHDVDKHLSFYLNSPELIFILNTDIIRGWDNLRDKQTIWWKNADDQYEFHDLRITFLSDTAMSTIANLSSEYTDEKGKKAHADFAFSATWLKRKSGWRIATAHETIVPRC